MYFRCSSSVNNWEERIRPWAAKRPSDSFWFFGIYHWGDILRFALKPGKKTIFWCGSDILALTPLKAWFIRKAEHRCENAVEQITLYNFRIYATIQPVFFGDPTKFRPTFNPSRKVHAYLCAHEGREEEYGVNKVLKKAKDLPSVIFHVYGVEPKETPPENVIFHGRVSEEQFNRDIPFYHIALRFNEFDGFSDVLAKSVLLGQFQYSAIKYPHMFSGKQWAKYMRFAVKAKKHNQQAWEYWHHTLSQ